jgi:hypothetical protein
MEDNILSLLSGLEAGFHSLQREAKERTERNLHLFKILATVKNDLEKTLKKPESLANTVYACIDLLRANTPYFSATEGVNKVDPPLTDSEKTLNKSV